MLIGSLSGREGEDGAIDMQSVGGDCGGVDMLIDVLMGEGEGVAGVMEVLELMGDVGSQTGGR